MGARMCQQLTHTKNLHISKNKYISISAISPPPLSVAMPSFQTSCPMFLLSHNSFSHSPSLHHLFYSLPIPHPNILFTIFSIPSLFPIPIYFSPSSPRPYLLATVLYPVSLCPTPDAINLLGNNFLAILLVVLIGPQFTYGISWTDLSVCTYRPSQLFPFASRARVLTGYSRNVIVSPFLAGVPNQNRRIIGLVSFFFFFFCVFFFVLSLFTMGILYVFLFSSLF